MQTRGENAANDARRPAPLFLSASRIDPAARVRCPPASAARVLCPPRRAKRRTMHGNKFTRLLFYHDSNSETMSNAKSWRSCGSSFLPWLRFYNHIACERGIPTVEVIGKCGVTTAHPDKPPFSVVALRVVGLAPVVLNVLTSAHASMAMHAQVRATSRANGVFASREATSITKGGMEKRN